jgi:hypothetical protein
VSVVRQGNRGASRAVMAAVVLALALAPTVPAAAAARAASKPVPAAPTNADCLACHEDPSLEASGGRKVGVAPPAFEASVHGQAGLACIDCHADLATTTDFPHPERLRPVDCSSCHGEAVEQYRSGIHGQSRAKSPGGLAATCVDCHGSAHEVRTAKDPQSPTYHFNLPKTCGRCHGDTEIIQKAGIAAGNVPVVFHDSIHGKALNESGLLVAPTCATCHGHHDIRRKTDEGSRVARQNIPATCGSCHAGIKSHYDEGVHAAAVRGGNLKAAVCSDCHSAHGIKAANLPSWRLDVVRECGTCHEESIRTYRDGFHGQASSLGFTRVAMCADCHGAHDILPRSDPRSRIAPAHRVETCRKCHQDANANFAAFDPHADPSRKDRSQPVYYTARFMKLLLGGVFAFFGIHTALWFPREIRARRQRPNGDRPRDGGPSATGGPGPGSSSGEGRHGA